MTEKSPVKYYVYATEEKISLEELQLTSAIKNLEDYEEKLLEELERVNENKINMVEKLMDLEEARKASDSLPENPEE